MAYIYGLETMALTAKQQEMVQICESNWITIIWNILLMAARFGYFVVRS